MPSPYRELTCERCNRRWLTQKATARTCSPKCRAELRETEKPSPGRPKREYPEEIVRKVQELYASGHTVDEIRDLVGPGYRIQTLVERYVPVRRPAVPRDQKGERGHGWKGDAASYQALHLRVEAARGKPSRCACCDKTDPDAKYEWANLSGRYSDINDFARLCIPCHRRLDAHRRATTGKRLSPPRGGDGDV